MRAFVFGADADYQWLRELLNDHLCHVFYHRAFPESFSKGEGRLGFEYDPNRRLYILYIDSGITCQRSDVPPLLSMWLQDGKLQFLDFNDLKQFLRGLGWLY